MTSLMQRRWMHGLLVVVFAAVAGCVAGGGYDGGVDVGVVAEVQFAMTPDGGRRLSEAAPLLAVMARDGDEVLIPFAKAFLVGVNTEARRIDMTLPEGLIDVNRSGVGSRNEPIGDDGDQK